MLLAVAGIFYNVDMMYNIMTGSVNVSYNTKVSSAAMLQCGDGQLIN